ncbi:MAG TPA: secretin N-terminal domain-containing protein, partial [Gemmataceae bacterium]|nr:secretin N-terminal domain-containing protein [Gemmataceae bacterium]
MSEASRTSVWPRRWVRSFAGAALATGLAGSLAAQDPPKLPDPPKLDLPKAPEAPKTGTKDVKEDRPAAKERMISFRKSGERWDAVLEWYANESGLSFNSVEPPPTATFTFIPPTDPKTKQPKQYTLAGITDILNEALLAKNYVLIRGTTTFQLWPADKAIDPSLVRRVSLEELKTLAVRDMVQVYLPLKILSAPDQVADVKKMMSKAGEVVSLTGTNTLLMIDMAGTLRRIVEDLQESESDTGGTSEQLTHKCDYVKARDAKAHLETLLRTGDEAGGRGGFDPRMAGFDPRMQFDPRMMEGGGRDRRGGQSTRGVRPTNIVADDATNTVYVNATADKVGQAKAFLLKYDVPPHPGAEKVRPGKADWVTHTVPAGSAEAYANALNMQYRGTSVRIAALSQNQIMVLGTPDDQLAVIEFVKKGTTQSNPTFEAIAINSMDAGDAVILLKGMFVAPDKGGPIIEKHASGSGIIVKGRPEQIAEVKAAIRAGIDGDAASGPGIPGGGNIRVINLKEGNAAALAEGIRALMEGMGKPAPKLNVPGGRPPEGPAPKPVEPKPDGPKAMVEPGEPKKFGLGVRDLGDRTMYISEQLTDPMKPAEAKPKTGAGVTITAVGNRLIITGDDPAQVALAHELAQLIAKGGETFDVFRLKNADATEAARVLNEWFNGPQQPPGRNNQNPFAQIFSGGRGGGGFGGPFGGGFGQQPADGTTPGQPRVRIVAEQSSNSLLVKASQLDLLTIKSLLDTVIDRGATDSNAVVRAFTIGPLQYAVATEVVDILLTVYRESTASAGTTGGRAGGGNAFAAGFGGLGGFSAFGGRQQPLDAMGRPRQVSLTIAADDRTNSIFGTATETMRKDIETLVTEMEKRAKDSTTVVELVPVKGVDPNMVQSVIDAIQGRPATTGTMGGMNRGGFGQQGFGQQGFGQQGFGGFGQQ